VETRVARRQDARAREESPEMVKLIGGGDVMGGDDSFAAAKARRVPLTSLMDCKCWGWVQGLGLLFTVRVRFRIGAGRRLLRRRESQACPYRARPQAGLDICKGWGSVHPGSGLVKAG